MTSFWSELKRRNVYKVGAVYAIVAWIVLQVASIVLPTFAAPPWVMAAFTLLLGLGFPIAVILAWAYEITPDGIRKTDSVASPPGSGPLSGRKLNVLVTALLALAVVVLIIDNYVLDGSTVAELASSDAPGSAAPARAGARRSIAVLPFESRSALEDDEFFVGGLHDDILTQLAGIAGLRVISRTSVMEYRDQARNLREIGAALGVEAILEGGVQRAGDTVRMNFQLIDAASDEHLWADQYDRELTAANVLAIQSEVARAIAAALETQLTPQEQARLDIRPTSSTRAYELYLRAREYRWRAEIGGANMRVAVTLLEQAVAEDPAFALAWAELARMHMFTYWLGLDRSVERRALALAAVERAFALDPELPEAHLARGHYLYHGFLDYDGALAELALAERGLPGSVDVLDMQAAVYRRLGQWDRVAELLERIAEIDPRAAGRFADLGRVYFVLRDYARAEAYMDRALDIAPELVAAHLSKASIPLLRDGDGAAANARLAASARVIGNDQAILTSRFSSALFDRDYAAAIRALDEAEISNPLIDIGQAIVYRLVGDEARAAASIESARQKLAARPPPPVDVDPPAGYWLAPAAAEALAGNTERALELAEPAFDAFDRDAWSSAVSRPDFILNVLIPAGAIDRAFAELDTYFATGAIWTVETLVADPRFDPIRDDPRTAELIETYR